MKNVYSRFKVFAPIILMVAMVYRETEAAEASHDATLALHSISPIVLGLAAVLSAMAVAMATCLLDGEEVEIPIHIHHHQHVEYEYVHSEEAYGYNCGLGYEETE